MKPTRRIYLPFKSNPKKKKHMRNQKTPLHLITKKELQLIRICLRILIIINKRILWLGIIWSIKMCRKLQSKINLCLSIVHKIYSANDRDLRLQKWKKNATSRNSRVKHVAMNMWIRIKVLTIFRQTSIIQIINQTINRKYWRASKNSNCKISLWWPTRFHCTRPSAMRHYSPSSIGRYLTR